jgi:hypothetical protein
MIVLTTATEQPSTYSGLKEARADDQQEHDSCAMTLNTDVDDEDSQSTADNSDADDEDPTVMGRSIEDAPVIAESSPSEQNHPLVHQHNSCESSRRKSCIRPFCTQSIPVKPRGWKSLPKPNIEKVVELQPPPEVATMSSSIHHVEKRKVTFHLVHVREFELTLGDNPR